MTKRRLTYLQVRLLKALSTRFRRTPPLRTRAVTFLSLVDRKCFKLHRMSFWTPERYAGYHMTLTTEGARALRHAIECGHDRSPRERMNRTVN